jgi:adenosylhomocysteine nucleosidase
MRAIDPGKLLIFTAVHMEARAIGKAFGMAGVNAAGPVQLPVTGSIVELCPIGIRATHMPRSLSPQAVRCIVMTGLAGALDPSLRCGQVVIDGWPANIPIDSAFHCGTIHTASHAITTVEDKARLYHQTGALAVDMESAIVRQTAHQLGIPFVSIRAIADTATDALDPVVMTLIDDLGRPKPIALTAALLRRPMLVPHLRRLQQMSSLALLALGDALKRLLNGPGPWTIAAANHP